MAAVSLSIVAGVPFGEAMVQTYHKGATVEEAWDVLRSTLGLGALASAVRTSFRCGPGGDSPA
jgi:hypothetical protein